MKLNKLFSLLAIAVIASVAFVGCNKPNNNGGGEPTSEYSVYQKITWEVSDDLFELAKLDYDCLAMDGIELALGTTLVGEDTAEYECYATAVNQPLKFVHRSTLKENYTEGTYTELSFNAEIYVELRKNGQKVSSLSKTLSQSKTNVKVDAESAKIIGLLNGTEYGGSIELVKNEDGSYELVKR